MTQESYDMLNKGSKKLKEIFGNRKNLLRYLSYHDYGFWRMYLSRYKKNPLRREAAVKLNQRGII